MSTPWVFDDESARAAVGSLTLVQGSSFVICDPGGDIIDRPRGVEGAYVADTRICSRFVVRVDGGPVEALASNLDQPFAARFVGRSADKALLVRRAMWVGRGVRVDLVVENRGTTARSAEVTVEVATDLADLFAVKESRAVDGPVGAAVSADGRGLDLGVTTDTRAAVVRAGPGSAEPRVDPTQGTLRWRVDLPARGRWSTCVEAIAVRSGEAVVPLHRCGEPGESSVPVPHYAGWAARLPRLETDVRGLGQAFDRATVDLGALQLVDPAYPDDPVVAAGAPWFMTLFGRDSIFVSLMTMMLDPGLGLATARTLARLQGKRTDPATEEQPGRIVHELRHGPGATLALDDASRYYGTADATPLFVVLVHELWRWGVPWEEIEPLLPAVDAALDWVLGPGDPDGDGFVEYQRLSKHGLANQGWKDSWDAIAGADGRLAEPPIALSEVQAYAYAALLAGADLALEADQPDAALGRTDRAMLLAARFDDAFWLPERGWYALALDGDKRPVDALASNLGHLLWSGIVPEARVASVATALVSPPMRSGWGVRTMATTMGRYDPLGYHTGSVWPHDTAIAVAGLRRAGCVDAALDLAGDLLAAAEACHGRLPELFAGLGPEDLPVPVPYPASCSPQAWASAAPLLVLRALLGLEPCVPEGRVEIDPILPAGARHLWLRDMPLAGDRLSIEVDGDALAVRGLPPGLAVVRQRRDVR
jgi:glycogen debranching enzyme